MPIYVFKFGGAAFAHVAHIEKIAAIVRAHKNKKLLLVVSAAAGITNDLEAVAHAYYTEKKSQKAQVLFDDIKKIHHDLSAKLFSPDYAPQVQLALDELCHEVDFTLNGAIEKPYDYYYDQIVSCGELLSSTLLAHYLQHECTLANTWIDARDVLRSDTQFRQANILWDESEKNMQALLPCLFTDKKIAITQGFIAATADNETTTLGRNGSDFSAAIFAHLCAAECLSIWKDVQGVMNIDPKKSTDVQVLTQLNYRTLTEIAYHGARVTHNKTLQPLVEKNIPMHVRSFLTPALAHSVVSSDKETIPANIPIIITKKEQKLLHLCTHDLSFMSSAGLQKCVAIFSAHALPLHIWRMDATELYVLVSMAEEIPYAELEVDFEITQKDHLTMLTIFNPTEEIIRTHTQGSQVLQTLRSADSVKFLLAKT